MPSKPDPISAASLSVAPAGTDPLDGNLWVPVTGLKASPSAAADDRLAGDSIRGLESVRLLRVLRATERVLLDMPLADLDPRAARAHVALQPSRQYSDASRRDRLFAWIPFRR